MGSGTVQDEWEQELSLFNLKEALYGSQCMANLLITEEAYSW